MQVRQDRGWVLVQPVRPQFVPQISEGVGMSLVLRGWRTWGQANHSQAVAGTWGCQALGMQVISTEVRPSPHSGRANVRGRDPVARV